LSDVRRSPLRHGEARSGHYMRRRDFCSRIHPDRLNYLPTVADAMKATPQTRDAAKHNDNKSVAAMRNAIGTVPSN
jgi:hypothetical protein